MKDRAVSRYNISNGVSFASFPYTPEGLEQARTFRRVTPALKRRRIVSVIQCRPSTIPCGQLIQHT